MASTRLTNDMRNQIRENALKHRFKTPTMALVLDFSALALDAYAYVYGKTEARMNALPDGWLPAVEALSFKFGASYVTLKFSGNFPTRYSQSKTSALADFAGDPMPILRRVPYDETGGCREVFDAGSDFSVRYHDIHGAAETLNELVLQTRHKITATLDQFTTVEKLHEGWPEIEPFTVGVTPAPKIQLPAVPVASLNEALGLPV